MPGYGEVTNARNESLQDLSPRELAVVVPLVALTLFMGVASPAFTRNIEPSVATLLQKVRSKAAQTQATRRAALPAIPPGRAEGQP